MEESTIPDSWRAYIGLAAAGYVHRIIDRSDNEYSNRKVYHINSLEGFWEYLKRKLTAKGELRKEISSLP